MIKTTTTNLTTKTAEIKTKLLTKSSLNIAFVVLLLITATFLSIHHLYVLLAKDQKESIERDT